MSMIADLRLWHDSVTTIQGRDYATAVEKLERICQKSSKTLYNTACCQLAQNKLDSAIQYFSDALEKDEHMAIAYFQRGNTYFKQNKLTHALRDFEKCVDKFRGRKVIDYNQLGLQYKFYICEPLHNGGCVRATEGEKTAALDLLLQAQRTQAEPRHNAIQDSIRAVETGQRPALLLIPPDIVFRPPKSKMSNLSKKDYLGKAKVVSTVDGNSASGFEAPRKFESGLLTVDEIKQKSTSAPSSPAVTRKKPGPPPAVHQTGGKTHGQVENPAQLPKNVLGSLVLSITPADLDLQSLKSSSSDPTINRSSFSRKAQVIRQRAPDYQIPQESESNESLNENQLSTSSSNAIQYLSNCNSIENLTEQNGQSSYVPPPPNKPLPPRPQPRLQDKAPVRTEAPGRPNQPPRPPKPGQSPSMPSHPQKPTLSSQAPKPSQPKSVIPSQFPKPTAPSQPPKPKPPYKPANSAATKGSLEEVQALRAALKPVGDRTRHTAISTSESQIDASS